VYQIVTIKLFLYSHAAVHRTNPSPCSRTLAAQGCLSEPRARNTWARYVSTAGLPLLRCTLFHLWSLQPKAFTCMIFISCSHDSSYRFFLVSSETESFPCAGSRPTKLYRVIQSSSTILKEVAGEITWSRKCKLIFLSDSPPFPNYDVFTLMSLLLLWLSIFTRWKQIALTYQLIPLFAMKEKSKFCPL
jgi:hypothetical protein